MVKVNVNNVQTPVLVRDYHALKKLIVVMKNARPVVEQPLMSAYLVVEDYSYLELNVLNAALMKKLMQTYSLIHVHLVMLLVLLHVSVD